MAVDTAAKRSSVQAYILGGTRPPPDGTVSAADRAHVGWLYSGLTYAQEVVTSGAGFFRSLFYNIRWRIWP